MTPEFLAAHVGDLQVVAFLGSWGLAMLTGLMVSRAL
jgi:hypothetical protein